MLVITYRDFIHRFLNLDKPKGTNERNFVSLFLIAPPPDTYVAIKRLSQLLQSSNFYLLLIMLAPLITKLNA